MLNSNVYRARDSSTENNLESEVFFKDYQTLDSKSKHHEKSYKAENWTEQLTPAKTDIKYLARP
jgi:hypothetical protein